MKDDVEIFFSSAAQGQSRAWICLIVDDEDGYHETIVGKGATVVSPPESQPWNIREMYVKDLDGNLLSFGHRIDGEPEE